MDRAILDRNQRSDSTIDAPESPMTRARTKRFKEQLSFFMTSFFKERGHSSDSTRYSSSLRPRKKPDGQLGVRRRIYINFHVISIKECLSKC